METKKESLVCTFHHFNWNCYQYFSSRIEQLNLHCQIMMLPSTTFCQELRYVVESGRALVIPIYTFCCTFYTYCMDAIDILTFEYQSFLNSNLIRIISWILLYLSVIEPQLLEEMVWKLIIELIYKSGTLVAPNSNKGMIYTYVGTRQLFCQNL